MIDLTKLDLKKIFGISKGTEGMKRNQTKFVRAEIFEEGMEEYSDGQLHYVGDTKNGADFLDNDGVFYESKGMDGMFSKRKHNNTQTKSIVLKNFRKQVTKHTRASRNGKQITCPQCNTTTTVYHFSWSALGCQHCGSMVDKYEWTIK